MKSSRSAFVVLALALAVGGLASACSSGTRASSQKTPVASASPTKIGPSGAGTPSQFPLSTTSSSPIPRDTLPPGVGPCSPKIVVSQNAGRPEAGNFIQIQPSFPKRWGKFCDPLNAGDPCNITMSGGFTVADAKAWIDFQAWVPDMKDPYFQHEIGPLDPSGSFKDWVFPVITPRAEEIGFRMVLKNAAKVPIATSDMFVYKIDCGRS